MVVLDVGCGTRFKGDVNVDFFKRGWNRQESDQEQGEYLDPCKIPNFVVASALYLPFKSDCFDLVVSNHVIEHTSNPPLMIREMLRVSKRKVVVKCPHNQGTGARRPFHIQYFNTDWFTQIGLKLGVKVESYISCYDDAPLTQRLFQITPKPLKRFYSRNIPYRVVRKVERKLFTNAALPLEIETHFTKKANLPALVDDVLFYVVFNDESIMRDCFLKSQYVDPNFVRRYNNTGVGLGLPLLYNNQIELFLDRDCWLVFAHQDFILGEPLAPKLSGLDPLGVYGVIGSRLGRLGLAGQIIQTDGSLVGSFLDKPEFVEALDEMCLIVHTRAFRAGLRFDKRFSFHFYGADLCRSALQMGLDVKALQVSCQHKSKTLSGAIGSVGYRKDRERFREKWHWLLPITSTTGVVA